ncbi:MerR family DNA-binding transcriptional regulator [Bifidobacterium longum subsp. infantis]|nr:MerR family DNA-binding transcriptional regulator [Bifidobacterium longum]QOL44138.1 MerR family DNA-binding transcriptional regulator [Bifidobacterium longum subsp. infantis]
MGYSIGQVSRKTGLSEHTLRYYDGQGLFARYRLNWFRTEMLR